MTEDPAPSAPPASSPFLLPVLIVAAVFAAFLPALSAGFTNWDDQKNFVENYFYRGFAPLQFKWMLTSFHLGHWHPLTWITLGLDYVLWGMNARGYHLTSLLIHAANALLLFQALKQFLRLAGQEPSPIAAFVGALAYAVHPLRVESVVWITERRDVLCGFFVLLSVLAYLKRIDEERAGRPSARWLVLAVAAFGTSLLCKALGILLPAVLLLLDITLFGRFKPGSRRRVLLEKLPFLALSFADAAVMTFAMRDIQAVHDLGSYHFAERAAQAAYGLCFYALKTLWPTGLIAIYRIDEPLHPAEPKYILAMIAVVGVTALLFIRRRRWPGPFVAWISYGILVFPVLGVAVNGKQIAADRYTYLCLLPASVLLTAGLDRLDRSGRMPTRTWATAAAGLLAVLALLTFLQSKVWTDSITLWSQQLRYDPFCDLAYNSRGAARLELGDNPGAIEDCSRSIQINDRVADAYLNRGVARARQDEIDPAMSDFDAVIRLDPDRADGYTKRGITRIRKGDYEGALSDLTQALEKRGSKAEAYAARGSVRASRGDLAGAAGDFANALKWAPPNWPARADVERKLDRARSGQ